MQSRIIKSVTLALTLWLSASLTMAADKAQEATTPTAGAAKAAEGSVKAKTPVKPSKGKKVVPKNLLDINSASKEALMKLPGIDAAAAEKIIAGRPYLTKTHLVSNGIIDRASYEGLKGQVIARQNKATAKKLEAMQKPAEKKKP